jgi:hypothetical protein
MNFDSFYEETLLPVLQELEQKRRNVIKNRMAMGIITAFIIFTHSLLIVMELLHPLTMFISLFLLPLLAYFIYSKFFDNTNEIEAAYKELIIKETLSSQIRAMNYKEDYYIQYLDFQPSMLYPMMPDHYSGSHYIKGENKFMTIAASHLHLGYEDSDKKWNEIFEGFFVIGESKTSIKSSTLLLADDLQENFGTLGKQLQDVQLFKVDFADKERVKTFEYVEMQNREFAKSFAVYSDNYIETQQILNETVCENILRLKNECGISLSLSISPQKIYAGIAFSEDQFAFNHWKTLLDKDKSLPAYEALRTTLEVMNDIVMRFIKKDKILIL